MGNALVRFEFWEYLVRIALEKYKTVCKTPSEMFAKLISDKVLTYTDFEPWQGFRDEQLWTIDVNDILEANEKELKKIYQSFQTSVKKYMTIDDILQMAVRDAQLNVPEKEVLFCYAMCKMTVTDEPKDYIKYQRLQWPEFLEFIGRLADIKFKHSPDMAQNDLAWKVETVLEELLPVYGLKKKDVGVEKEEDSQSDDDY